MIRVIFHHWDGACNDTEAHLNQYVTTHQEKSSNGAGALLNVSKGDEATYEAICDFNNQLASDSVRVQAVDEVFQNIQNSREGQNADLPSVEDIMKQLPSDVFAAKYEIQGRLKIHWE